MPPDPSLIVPLIKRSEPDGTDDPIVLPEGDVPVWEELTGNLHVAYVFDLPGMFRYVSPRDCARLRLPVGDLRALAVRNLTRRRPRPQIKEAPAAAMFVLDGDLEASLLLKAAARLQEVQESWTDKKPAGLDEALLYNRRLWTVFIDAVMSEDNKLPKQVCQNLAALGMRVMGDTFSMMTKPQPEQLTSLININRGIAAGLRGKA